MAKRQFCVRNRDVFVNAQSPDKRWSTLRFALFCLSSPFVGGRGGPLCELVGKADLSDHFDGKLSREH